MTKEELYKLSLDSYHEYPLLAELMAIRDERFKDEQQDSMLCVNGYVGLDTLNNYVKLQQKNQQLKIQVSSREEVANKYKEVIDEARECIKNNYHLNWYVESNYKDELLQILDKGVDK